MPLAAVLRVLEGGVDKLAEGIIGTVPTCKDQAMKDLKALDGTLDETVTKLGSIIPGGSAGLGGAVNSAVGGLTGSLGNVVGGLTGGSKGSGDAKAGGLLGGLAGRGPVPTSLVTSVTGKVSDIVPTATKGITGLAPLLPTVLPHVSKGGPGNLAHRGLEDPAGPFGNKISSLLQATSGVPIHIMGDPTDLLDAVTSVSETPVPMPAPSHIHGGMMPPEDLAARQLGGLNNAKGAAKSVVKGAVSKATGLLSGSKPTGADSGALPAASDALGEAEGGVSDGSTGGLFGGLVGPKGGKGGKAGAAAALPKRFDVASTNGNCTDKTDKMGKMGKMEKRDTPTGTHSKHVEASQVANLIKFMADNINMPQGAMVNDKFPEAVESIKQISQTLAATSVKHAIKPFPTTFNNTMKIVPTGKAPKAVNATATVLTMRK